MRYGNLLIKIRQGFTMALYFPVRHLGILSRLLADKLRKAAWSCVYKHTLVHMEKGGKTMKISARNQLAGKVVEISEGQVNAKVVVDIGGGNTITSIISVESLKELELSVGSDVTTVIKSSSVMLMA
jgi:molybdopterin-binding protein